MLCNPSRFHHRRAARRQTHGQSSANVTEWFTLLRHCLPLCHPGRLHLAKNVSRVFPQPGACPEIQKVCHCQHRGRCPHHGVTVWLSEGRGGGGGVVSLSPPATISWFLCLQTCHQGPLLWPPGWCGHICGCQWLSPRLTGAIGWPGSCSSEALSTEDTKAPHLQEPEASTPGPVFSVLT